MPEVRQEGDIIIMMRVVACVLALTCAGSGAVIYNSLGAANAFFDGVCKFPGDSAACFGPLADSFTTGPVSGTLQSVGVLMKGASDGGQATVELLNDEGGRPGGDLLQLGVIKDSELTSAYKDIFFSVNFGLQADTRYWVKLFDSSAHGDESSADWGVCFASCQTALGVPGEFFANEGDVPGGWNVFANTFGPYQMEVAVETGRGATPESGSFVLLCIAGIGAGIGRRKRSKKS